MLLHSVTWREPQRQHQQAGTAHSGCTHMVWNLRLDWNRRFCWLHYTCPPSVLLASLVSLSPNSYIKLLTMRIEEERLSRPTLEDLVHLLCRTWRFFKCYLVINDAHAMPHCQAFSAEFHMHLLFLFSAACRDKNICHYEHTETKDADWSNSNLHRGPLDHHIIVSFCLNKSCLNNKLHCWESLCYYPRKFQFTHSLWLHEDQRHLNNFFLLLSHSS